MTDKPDAPPNDLVRSAETYDPAAVRRVIAAWEAADWARSEPEALNDAMLALLESRRSIEMAATSNYDAGIMGLQLRSARRDVEIYKQQRKEDIERVNKLIAQHDALQGAHAVAMTWNAELQRDLETERRELARVRQQVTDLAEQLNSAIAQAQREE